MNVYEYTAEDAARSRCPFQDAFASDLWVAFHGTSNHVASRIESHGFEWHAAPYSFEDVEQLLRVFDTLFWNASPEGRGILATFTRSDFASGPIDNHKGVYFGETSHRSLPYSQPHYAGGETAMAIRRAFKDLDDFQSSPTVRQQAYRSTFLNLNTSLAGGIPDEHRPARPEAPTAEEICSIRRFFKSHGMNTLLEGRATSEEPAVPSESWLQTQLSALSPLRARVEAFRDTYEYGVVYAVRFVEEDLPHMTGHSAGLLSRRRIPADRILAKAIVSIDAHHSRREGKTNEGHSQHTMSMFRGMQGDGLVSRLWHPGAKRA